MAILYAKNYKYWATFVGDIRKYHRSLFFKLHCTRYIKCVLTTITKADLTSQVIRQNIKERIRVGFNVIA